MMPVGRVKRHVRRHPRQTILGAGMSAAAKARDIEQSDREYIRQLQRDYARGYRNGHADRLLGIRSRYAEAPEHGYYARGYTQGVLGLPTEFEPLRKGKKTGVRR